MKRLTGGFLRLGSNITSCVQMGSGRMHLCMLDFLIFVTLRRRSLKERFPEVKSMLLAWLPEAEATTCPPSISR
jgi:hypothetical protein